MQSFKTFVEQQNFVDFVLNEFDSTQKSWSAKKDEIMQSWQNLRPEAPIYMKPISQGADHKSIGEDGLRITGSWEFIASVLGKLKELMQYENDQTKLKLVFKGVDGGDPSRQTFVFYVNVEGRQKSPERI